MSRTSADCDLSLAFTEAAYAALYQAHRGNLENMESWHMDLALELMTAEYKRRRADWERAYRARQPHKRV